VLDNFNELFRNSRAAVAKHKGELGEGDKMLVAAYLSKAAKGQFGDNVFNELKEIFAKPSNGNGETKHITPRVRIHKIMPVSLVVLFIWSSGLGFVISERRSSTPYNEIGLSKVSRVFAKLV
jgi:hypothetical protein